MDWMEALRMIKKILFGMLVFNVHDDEDLNDLGRMFDIHPVCLLCTKPCKKHYGWWSFQMPPQEYCEDFEENPNEVIEIKEVKS